MAAFILGILIALQSPNPAVQQRDTRTWYQAYDAAVKDIANSRWQSAITNLQLAVKLGPKPARSVLTYGDVAVKFVPDYYLGVAYLNLKQYAEADRAFQAVQRTGLIGPKDTEYSAFTAQSGTAAFEAEMAAAEQAFTAKQYDLARKVAEAAKGRGTGANASRVTALISRIDDAIRAATAVPNPPPVNPGPVAPSGGAPPPVGSGNPSPTVSNPPDSTRPPVGLPSNPKGQVPITSGNQTVVGPRALTDPYPRPNPPDTSAEDTAIAPYFAGNYATAVSGLTSLIAGNAASPRVFFYLACSKVALVFTGGADESALKEAQAALGSAGNTSQFATDLKFISPRILQRLGVR
jgi:tetratricopeptide (TPR) repeat protein